MCGILAVINKKKSVIDEKSFKKSLEIMKSRGPDWTFIKKINNFIYFGQNVLSMTGKKTKNQSIFFSKSKRYLIILNGEIYNFNELKEFTELESSSNLTDTEVLINLIEKKGIEKSMKLIDGMYVFLVYDYKTNSIYYSRDPQGEKALYCYEDSNLIIFSSEIGSIYEYIGSLDLDPFVLETYFYTRHFIQFKKTIYKNLKIINMGELVKINLDNFAKKVVTINNNLTLVDIKLYTENLSKKLDYHLEQLEYLLLENLKNMIPKNRNFASIVSGGIDSSLITALLEKISKPKALLALNHIDNDTITNNFDSFNEFFNNKIKIIDVLPNDYIYNLNKIYTAYLSPIHSHSFVGQFMISSIANKSNCKAIFGGEGVDEIFGGYDTYSNIENFDKNNSIYSKIINFGLFAKNPYQDEFVYENDLSWKQSYQTYSFIKDKKERNMMSMMLNDLNYQVSAVGLRGSDLMGMANGVEQRSVFLRRSLISYGLNLPLQFKINQKEKNKNLQNKFIIKKLFTKYFRKDLVYRKQGFSGFPNSLDAFLGPKKNFIIQDILNFKNFDFLSNCSNQSLIWKLNNTELFLRHFYGNYN